MMTAEYLLPASIEVFLYVRNTTSSMKKAERIPLQPCPENLDSMVLFSLLISDQPTGVK
jgi:hypothetical protein